MSTLKLNIDAPGLGMTFTELRFQDDITLGTLKSKLEMKTGFSPKSMVLTLKDGPDEVLSGDDVTLKALGLSDLKCNLELNDSDSGSMGNHLFDEAAVPTVEAEADEGFRAFRAEARAKVNAANQDAKTTATEKPAEAAADAEDEI